MTLRATALLLLSVLAAPLHAAEGPAELRRLASDYYRWRNEAYPVASTDQGLHTGDARLTDWSAAAVADRRARVRRTLDQVRALATEGWSKDDRVDAILFTAQLEGADFFDRELQSPESNPGIYVDECGNAIFSLLKKEFDSKANRARSATARLEAVRALLQQARGTLVHPYGVYARLAIDSARAMDSLYGEECLRLPPNRRQRPSRACRARCKCAAPWHRQ